MRSTEPVGEMLYLHLVTLWASFREGVSYGGDQLWQLEKL